MQRKISQPTAAQNLRPPLNVFPVEIPNHTLEPDTCRFFTGEEAAIRRILDTFLTVIERTNQDKTTLKPPPLPMTTRKKRNKNTLMTT
ncbi:hypothetical protein L873DRAFT_1798764 [Choiromyces venosus 120613-1]|uniref:Uncharacterized protein n=1 Tax=Choiromyces venosus 120613-1 TaxID=1336337 RepID=A0A3N4K2X1_9PEZI|nr:hypothetical protein L873DRAFT_1798764 [Choiromyces venosus 120613-1]